MKRWAAIAVCLAVVSVAQAGDVVEVEDPSNVADEFMDQLEFDEMDNQQSRGQLYVDELKGLNQVEAKDHSDLGESDDISSSIAQCDDEACRVAVRDIVKGAQLGEGSDGEGIGGDSETSENGKAGDKKEEEKDSSCKDYHAEICRHKQILCDHARHGNDISAQCPRTCGVCAMFSKSAQSSCKNRTDACKVEGRAKYCKITVVSNICPVLCSNCPSEKGDTFSESMER